MPGQEEEHSQFGGERKAGAKLEDFAVHKSVAVRNVSPKKPKTRRRAKVAGGARRAPKAKRRPILTAAPDEQP